MIRLFVAIEIEDVETWRRILDFRNSLASCSINGGIKPVEDENIHLTLRFIGEVPDNYVGRIIEYLRVVENFKKFSITVQGVGAFPSVARPRVLWVGITSGVDILRRIRSSFEGQLKSLVGEDGEEFVPHITVARIKGRYKAECLSENLRRYEATTFGVSPVTQVKLKRSQLTPKGPIYTDIATFRLKDDVPT